MTPLSFYSLHLRLWCFGRSRGVRQPAGQRRAAALPIFSPGAPLILTCAVLRPPGTMSPTGAVNSTWMEWKRGTAPLFSGAYKLFSYSNSSSYWRFTAHNRRCTTRWIMLAYGAKREAIAGRVNARKLNWDVLWVTNEVLGKLGTRDDPVPLTLCLCTWIFFKFLNFFLNFVELPKIKGDPQRRLKAKRQVMEVKYAEETL